MKKKIFYPAGILFSLAAAASFALAEPPPWAPAHGRRGKEKSASSAKTVYSHQYKYFPGAQVYFDAARNLYFYQENNGQWAQAAQLPQSLLNLLGQGVDLEMSTATPQQYHQQIVTTYSTSGGSAAQSMMGQSGASALQQGMKTETVTETTVTRTRTVTQGGAEAGAAGMGWAPQGMQAPGAQAVQYRYYPGAQVYFDAAKSLYFYQEKNGQWAQAAQLPQNLLNLLGQGVDLEMSTQTPYQYHQQVIGTYPALSGAAQSVKSYSYQYYPASSVYYDPGREVYFYSLNNQWLSSKTLPKGLTLNRQEAVTVDIDSQTPYIRHQEILQKYGHGASAVRQVQEKIKVDVKKSGVSSQDIKIKIKEKGGKEMHHIKIKEKGGKGMHQIKIKEKHK